MATASNISIESLALVLKDLQDLREELSNIANFIEDASAEPAPIPDVYVRIPSFSRSNVSHVVRVKDGLGRCACEAATFKPERGACIHFTEAKSLGLIDRRAQFIGGL